MLLNQTTVELICQKGMASKGLCRGSGKTDQECALQDMACFFSDCLIESEYFWVEVIGVLIPFVLLPSSQYPSRHEISRIYILEVDV